MSIEGGYKIGFSEKDLLIFARKAAARFCWRNHCPELIDDATGEAVAYLIKNRDKIDAIDKPLLFYRVQCALLNVYRKEFRRRNKFKTDDGLLVGIVDERNDVESFDNREEARYLINRAAINAGAVDFLPLFFAMVTGSTQKQAADSFGVSLRTVSRYWGRFMAALKKLKATGD